MHVGGCMTTQVQALVLATLVALAMATGVAIMFGGPPMAGRLWRFVWGQARRHATTFLRFLWRNHRREVLGFVAGVLVTLFFLGRL